MNFENDYLEVQFKFDENNYEEIYNTLYFFGIKAILEENKRIIIYISGTEKDKLKILKSYLLENDIIDSEKILVSEFEDKNWNSEWEKSIEPVIIKNKIIIYPGWKKSDLKSSVNKILIQIDPKMSFGTGHNETTQLVLEFLVEDLEPDDNYILDYGCGTGILAIAAAKLGTEKVIAIDIDEDSINNAKEYISINHTSGKITLYKSDITGISENNFDVICVNIIRSVIENNLVTIYEKLKLEGKLFISGVLTEEESRLINSLKTNNFKIAKIKHKAEWTGIYAIKN